MSLGSGEAQPTGIQPLTEPKMLPGGFPIPPEYQLQGVDLQTHLAGLAFAYIKTAQLRRRPRAAMTEETGALFGRIITELETPKGITPETAKEFVLNPQAQDVDDLLATGMLKIAKDSILAVHYGLRGENDPHKNDFQLREHILKLVYWEQHYKVDGKRAWQEYQDGDWPYATEDLFDPSLQREDVSFPQYYAMITNIACLSHLPPPEPDADPESPIEKARNYGLQSVARTYTDPKQRDDKWIADFIAEGNADEIIKRLETQLYTLQTLQANSRMSIDQNGEPLLFPLSQ